MRIGEGDINIELFLEHVYELTIDAVDRATLSSAEASASFHRTGVFVNGEGRRGVDQNRRESTGSATRYVR
jgi:hypothetical protein